MANKPNFAITQTREQRLNKAKKELENEESQSNSKTIQTTLILEASLLYAVKEIALKRKQAGIKPDTVTGIIKDALKAMVNKENNI